MTAWRTAFAQLLEQTVGIAPQPTLLDRAENFLACRKAALELGSVDAYLDLLRAPNGNDELQAIVNVVSVPKTSFFRYAEQIDRLVQDIVPALHARLPPGAPLRIWSTACATGEEPYSMAMALLHAGWPQRRPVEIVASDINTDVLARARAGRYPTAALAVPGAQAARPFLAAVGAELVVDAAVQKLVRFERMNIVHLDARADGPWHVIVCANVLIYFSPLRRQDVLAQLRDRMHVDGSLLLGGAEMLDRLPEGLAISRIGDTFVYGRTAKVSLAGQATTPGADRAARAKTTRATRVQRPTPSPPPPPVRTPATARAPAGRDFWQQAVTLLAGGFHNEAAAAAASALEEDPLSVELHFVRGRTLRALGLLVEGEEAFRRALFLDPGFLAAHYEVGLCLHLGGHHQRAAAAYDRGLRGASSSQNRTSLDGICVSDDIARYLCQENRVRALRRDAPISGVSRRT